jgi:hypothetical protein
MAMGSINDQEWRPFSYELLKGSREKKSTLPQDHVFVMLSLANEFSGLKARPSANQQSGTGTSHQV